MPDSSCSRGAWNSGTTVTSSSSAMNSISSWLSAHPLAAPDHDAPPVLGPAGEASRGGTLTSPLPAIWMHRRRRREFLARETLETPWQGRGSGRMLPRVRENAMLECFLPFSYRHSRCEHVHQRQRARGFGGVGRGGVSANLAPSWLLSRLREASRMLSLSFTPSSRARSR